MFVSLTSSKIGCTSKIREFMMEEHVRNISKEIEEYKKSQEEDPIKATSDPIKSFSDPIKERLYQAVL